MGLSSGIHIKVAGRPPGIKAWHPGIPSKIEIIVLLKNKEANSSKIKSYGNEILGFGVLCPPSSALEVCIAHACDAAFAMRDTDGVTV